MDHLLVVMVGLNAWLWGLRKWSKGLDKRYQVFISSTFLDLREERQAVSQALLRSDCFPAQMENWGAMDAEQMEAIKPIIDESDYFLVISAGKYGSIHPETGLSYTEMEYDYAMEVGKPIIRLLHMDPFNALRGDQIESKAGVRKKLEAFRAKLGERVVYATWENADQLEKETFFGLDDIKKRKPALGWSRVLNTSDKNRAFQKLDSRQTKASLELREIFSNISGEALIRKFNLVEKGAERTEILNQMFFNKKPHEDYFKMGTTVYTRGYEDYEVKLKDIVERILIALPLAPDIPHVFYTGMNNAQVVGGEFSTFYLPLDEELLNSVFMDLIGRGVISSKGFGSDYFPYAFSKKSEYLRRSGWVVLSRFKRELAALGYHPFTPKTPPQSAP